MTHAEFNHIVESINGLSPEKMRQLRRKLDDKLASATAKQPAGNDLGSIGAMREDADFLDKIVADAMKARQEQPWRLPPGE